MRYLKKKLQFLIIPLSLFLLFIVAEVKAQVQFEWAKRIGSSGFDIGWTPVIDSNGDLYSVGEFSGTVDFDPGPGIYNLTTPENNGSYILKLNSSGDFVWAKAIPKVSIFTPLNIFALTLDNTNNLVISGYFTGTIDFDPGPGTFNMTSGAGGGTNAFIMKLDLNGDFIWAKALIGDYSGAFAITTDNSNNIFVTGYFSETIDFDPNAGVVNLTSSNSDIFVLKLNALGNYQWVKRTAGTSSEAFSIKLDQTGNIYICGIFEGTVDFNPGVAVNNLVSSGNSDAYILKLDINGNYVWAKKIGASGQDRASVLAVDANNNIIVSGHFTATIDSDPGVGINSLVSSGEIDVFVIKFDENGTHIWGKSMGGIGEESSQGMCTDNSGNVITTGYYTNDGDFDPGATQKILKLSGSQNVFVSKLDSNGNYLWAQSIQGNPISGYILYTSDNLFISGSFSGSIKPDPDTTNSLVLTSEGTHDFYITKWNLLPEINIKQNSTTILTDTTYNFGDVNVLMNSAITNFTIENSESILSLSGIPSKISISGPNASDFTIDESTLSSSIAGGSSSIFTITFTPSATGVRTATISIANNDLDENPYIINLTGTGVKIAQAISGHTAIAKTYGDADFNLTGVASSGLTVSYAISNPSVATLTGTTITILNAGITNITASQAGDGSYSAAPDTTIVLTINKAPLTVTVSDQSKNYGATNPAFTYTYSGFVNGEDATVLDTEPIAAPSSVDAGINAIVASGGVDNNYDFIYVDGDLTVAKVPLTITADNQSRNEGQANPPFTLSYSGFVNSETSAVLDVLPAAACSAVPGSAPGPYPITLSGGNDNNYNYSLVDGTLTVNSGIGSTLDVLSDTGFCKGENVQLNAVLDNLIYRWYYNGSIVSSVKQPVFDEDGLYILEVEDGSGNTARDSAYITENTLPLTSAFLLASESGIEDTTVAVDISFAKPDSLLWNWGGATAVKKTDDTYFLTFPATGTYTIQLTSYLGYCAKVSQNIIEIVPGSVSEQGGLLFPDIIREVSASPNPTGGTITLKTLLGNSDLIIIYLYDSGGNLLYSYSGTVAEKSHSNVIDLGARSSGLYTIRVVSGVDQRVLRVIKL